MDEHLERLVRLQATEQLGLGGELLNKPPFPPRTWLRPSHVSLQDEALEFSYSLDGKMLEAPRDLMFRFAGLDNAAAILRFARRWGPLGLCEHGLSATHSQRGLPAHVTDNWNEYEAAVYGDVEFAVFCSPLEREPITMWLELVSSFNTMLDLNINIFERGPGATSDWDQLRTGPLALRIDATAGRRLGADRQLLGAAANAWLEVADLVPRFRWQPRASVPQFDLVAGGLFSALVLQLVAVVGRTDGLSRCSACGKLFTPKRLPTHGERRYCKPCRDGGKSVRDAQRNWVRPPTKKGQKS